MVERLSGGDELNFTAIDGTCWKKDMEPYLVFFSAAYTVRGSISFLKNPEKVKYEKWSTEQDTSVVAYVPIPYAQLSELNEEDISSDQEKFDFRTFIHH